MIFCRKAVTANDLIDTLSGTRHKHHVDTQLLKQGNILYQKRKLRMIDDGTINLHDKNGIPIAMGIGKPLAQ